MHGYNLIAIYPTLEEARRVSDRLLAEGISPADLRLTDASGTQLTGEVAREPHHERGFFDWLFASDVPDYDRDRYSAHLNERRAAVSVRAADRHWHDRIIAIMEEFDPIDIEEDGHAAARERHAAGASAFGTTSLPHSGTIPARTDPGATARAEHAATGRTDTRTGTAREHEEVIPVVKEELDVGKRATERRYRVKSYVIEHPVEKTVTLRDERVEIEHRPVSRTQAGGTQMPQEREIEVVERHEEPVVEKRATANEEIVVRKETVERPETVRGTVRETRVDIEKEPAGTTSTTERGAGGTTPRIPGQTGR
jgi:stress response protein YsnF